MHRVQCAAKGGDNAHSHGRVQAKRVANGMMDARMLNYLFIRFEEESIAFDARSFSIDIRSGEGKNKLLRLDKDQYERVKKALSVSQRTFYMNNKIEFDIKNGK